MPRGRPPKKASEQDFPYGSIKKIVNHSLDPQTRLVTLTVSLAANKEHQISEWDAQEFRPELLQSYWDSFDGKTRQDVLGIGELYHPFRILRHRRVRGQWQVLVQWLGYSAAGEDVSWEPASKLRHDAPDVVVDYIKYVEDEGARAALLGPLAAPEAGKEEKGDKEKEKEKPAAAGAVATPAPVKSAKRKRESLVGEAEPVSDKRRRSSRYESTPTAAAKTPATKPSATKRRHSELPDAPAPQATPKSTRRQSKIPPPAEDVVSTTTTTTTTVVASSPARPQQRRKSSRASSAAPSASASASEATTTTRRLSPADVPRTMLWFMDDFTVGDMQKVCRFIDEHCSGKLRLPLYSGGNWDGKAASGRWEDVFMVSPLGRLGRYDDDEEEKEE